MTGKWMATVGATMFTLLVCYSAEFTIQNLKQPPGLIDGELTDSCWKKAPKTGIFNGLDGKTVTEKTKAFYFTDGKNLYVAFECMFQDHEAKMREIVSTGKGMKDSVEVFIDPGNTGGYVHFGLDLAGTLLYKTGLSGPIEYGVQVLKDRWVAEMKIPFKSLKLVNTTFSRDWKMNFTRGNSNKEFSTWAPLNSSTFHDHAGFNIIHGIGVDLERLSRLQNDAAKGIFSISFDRVLYDIQKKLAVTVNLKYEKSMKGFSLEYTLRNDGKKSVAATNKIMPVFFQNAFEIPISNLNPGKYTLTLALKDKNGTVVLSGSKTFWKIPEKRKLTGDIFTIKDNSIYRNGNLFFPVGIWSTTQNWGPEHDNNPDSYMADQEKIYRNIKNLGMNVIVNSGQDWMGENVELLKKYGGIHSWNFKTLENGNRIHLTFRKKLELAQRNGLFVAALMPYLAPAEFGDGNIDCWVNFMLRYRNQENIICYFMCDESDGATEMNKLRRQLYSEMDSEHLNYLNIINAVAQNKDAADILSTDPYPIPNGKIITISAHMKRLWQNVGKKQSPWLWLQLGGGWGSCTRAPNPAELRAMVYLSMNHGVRGIMYFTYQPSERRNGIIGNSETYATLPTLHSQIQKLAEVYLTWPKTEHALNGKIDYAVFRKNANLYISAVNTENSEQKFVLPIPTSGNKSVLFENRSPESSKNLLRDTFAPYEIHIYKMEVLEK